MDKFFDNFYNYKGFGPAIDSVIPSDSFCEHYQGLLPDQLLDYWKTYGFSGWGEGLFWIANPQDYKHVLKIWLEATPFAEKDDYHVIARTAFGQLLIWSTTEGKCLKIQSLYGMMYPNATEQEKLQQRGADQSIRLFFASKSKDSCDLDDESDKPLFDRTKEALGPLNSDEMYAFVPALALGGSAELKNLKKVKIIEHLVLLADLSEKRIMQDVNKILGPVS